MGPISARKDPHVQVGICPKSKKSSIKRVVDTLGTTEGTPHMTGHRSSTPKAIHPVANDSDRPSAIGPIDPTALGACEREVFHRWADRNGFIGEPDIDALLRQNLILRRLIADLVASAGRPRPGRRATGYVAEVPTEVIEDVGQYGDFSQIDDEEAVGKTWF